jgi:hypothetical protein
MAEENSTSPKAERTIVDAGVLSNRGWWLYSDGLFEGETVSGMQRFADLEDFRTFVETSPASRSQPAPPELVAAPEKPAGSEEVATRHDETRTFSHRLRDRLRSGIVVCVIGLGGWIILSEAIRLDDVRILERRAKLEHARKLQEARSPRRRHIGPDGDGR